MSQTWEQEKASILWIVGDPGVGKAMLAATTIEMLRNKYPQHSDIPSPHVGQLSRFRAKNPALQDSAQMWKAAALQMTKATYRLKEYAVATIVKKSRDTFCCKI